MCRFPHGGNGGSHSWPRHDTVNGRHLADKPPKMVKPPHRCKSLNKHVVLLSGPPQSAIADHVAERLHNGGMVDDVGVEVDEEVVCLGGAARAGWKGGEEDKSKRMVPHGGEEAEARERGRRRGGSRGQGAWRGGRPGCGRARAMRAREGHEN